MSIHKINLTAAGVKNQYFITVHGCMVTTYSIMWNMLNKKDALNRETVVILKNKEFSSCITKRIKMKNLILFQYHDVSFMKTD